MDLGPVTLRPRHQIHTLAAVVLGLGVAATLAAWFTLGPYRLFMSIALGLVTVLAPTWVLWTHATQRTVVHPDRIEIRGPRGIRRTLAYADLREVTPLYLGTRDTLDIPYNRAVLLAGTTTTGRRSLLRVSTALQESIAPVLIALAPVVDVRPELLPDDAARELFDRFLADARPDPGSDLGASGDQSAP